MSQEENRTVLRRIIEEAFNRGQIGVYDELVTPDAVDHAPPPGFSVGGPEAYKQFTAALRSAFPDLHYGIEQLIAEGDFAVSHTRNSGTHRGEIMGIPATGRRVEWTETHIVRVQNGKIVEHWGNFDALGMLQQLGAVPALA